MAIILEFEFKDILNWVGGLLGFLIILGICYLIGQLGVQVRSGINILGFINKTEKEIKQQGLVLNENGIALRKKGRRKIAWPITGICFFYFCIWLFVPKLEYKMATLILLIPIILGFFGIFLVPEQLAED